MAHDLFVHHFGGRTVAASGIDAQSQLDEDQRRFAAKWGEAEPDVRRVAVRPWSSPAETTPKLARPVRISLTMIVRNDEAARLWRAVLAECPGDREAAAKLHSLTPAASAP